MQRNAWAKLADIQALLGHTNLTTTPIYLQCRAGADGGGEVVKR